MTEEEKKKSERFLNNLISRHECYICKHYEWHCGCIYRIGPREEGQECMLWEVKDAV